MNEDEDITLNGNEPFIVTALFFLLSDKKEYGAIKTIAEALFDVGADAAVPWGVYRNACEQVAQAGDTESKSASERGLEALDGGRNEEAADHYAREIRGYAPIYFSYGLALFRLGSYPKAHRAFLKAVEIEPEDAEYLNLLGQSYDEIGERGEAELALLKSLKIDPDYAMSYYDLGVILSKWRTRDAEAKVCFDRAIALDPNMGWAYYCLACLKALEGKKRDALTYLRKALEKGVHDRKHIAKDSDLDSLRADAAFQRLMKKYFSEERGS